MTDQESPRSPRDIIRERLEEAKRSDEAARTRRSNTGKTPPKRAKGSDVNTQTGEVTPRHKPSRGRKNQKGK